MNGPNGARTMGGTDLYEVTENGKACCKNTIEMKNQNPIQIEVEFGTAVDQAYPLTDFFSITYSNHGDKCPVTLELIDSNQKNLSGTQDQEIFIEN